MPKITFFKAQQWAFSFSMEHGYQKEDVDYLLLGQMGWDLTQLLLNYQTEMKPAQWELFKENVEKMCQGYPPQYLLGFANFYGLKFKVTEATLIPRPDTEELVDYVLSDVKKEDHLKIADIGTGSGAIGLALKAMLPNSQVTLTDISPAAMEVAKENAYSLGLKADFKVGDLLTPLTNKYDVIVSNPPYIPRSEADLMDDSVKQYEPALALFAEKNGLAIYERLAKEIRPYIKTKAKLYLEVGFNQGEPVKKIFEQEFPHATVTVRKDLTGHERMVRVEF